MAAYRFPYLLAGNSVVLKQDSPFYEHFYKQLTPFVHYIPFKRDLSDLVEKIEWAQQNEDEVLRIIRNAQKFTRDHLLPRNILCYHVLLLKVLILLHQMPHTHIFNCNFHSQKWTENLIGGIRIQPFMDRVPVAQYPQCNCDADDDFTEHAHLKDEL